MSYVKKMLFKALKNNDLAEVVKKEFSLFGLSPILKIDRDFDWNYEQSKIDWIKHLIDAKKEYSIKAIKKAYKEHTKKHNYLWYEEYENKAKYILSNWKCLKGSSL